MRPTDVLIQRRLLLDQCRAVDPDGPMGELACLLAEGLVAADVFYVTADMTAVARSAARSMPDQVLRRDDLPSDDGFLIFDAPVTYLPGPSADTPVVGFAWTVVTEHGERFDRKYPDAVCRCELQECRYCATGTQPPQGATCECSGCRCEASEPVGYGAEVAIVPLLSVPAMSTVVPYSGTGERGDGMAWVCGDPPINEHGVVDDQPDLGKVLLATWTLMQQYLSVSERTPGDRPERRRSGRAKLPSDVLVVRLRRRSTTALDDDHGAESVPWSHRWLVNGHWRNQWLPSRSCHRHQWINGYVKGPAHKALVVKERVSAWVR